MNILSRVFARLGFVAIAGFSHPYAMETDHGLKRFELSFNGETYLFRQVVLENLEELDKKVFIESTNDFEAVEQMFGTFVAYAFSVKSYFNPATAYEAMLEKRKKEREKYSNTYKVFDWFIEDNRHSKYIGHISIFSPQTMIPRNILDQYSIPEDELLEMGAALTKDYRGKKIASGLAPLFINKLQECTEFGKAWIMLSTLTGNSPVHTVAEKQGFQNLGTIDDNFDFVLFERTIKVDLFARPVYKK